MKNTKIIGKKINFAKLGRGQFTFWIRSHIRVLMTSTLIHANKVKLLEFYCENNGKIALDEMI